MAAEPRYATRADLFRYGLPRGLLANPGREAGEVSVSGDTIELDAHGFENGESVTFRPETGGEMPAPLVQSSSYYVINATDNTFQVAATLNGPAINLTTSGSRVLVSSPLPVDDVIALYSRWVDGVLVAHGVPLEGPDYPIEVVAAVAVLSGARLLFLSGQRSIALGELELQEKAKLDRWAAGVPLRELQAAPRPTNLAIVATPTALPRNWVPTGDYDYLP